jgi:hypothetical protein
MSWCSHWYSGIRLSNRGIMSGFTVAAERLITFAKSGLQAHADATAKIRDSIPEKTHINSYAWPATDGGLRAAYESATASFTTAVDALARAWAASATALIAAAREYEKRDQEADKALRGH